MTRSYAQNGTTKRGCVRCTCCHPEKTLYSRNSWQRLARRVQVCLLDDISDEIDSYLADRTSAEEVDHDPAVRI